MTAVPGHGSRTVVRFPANGPRHAAHRRARPGEAYFAAAALSGGGAHRARHARKPRLDRYDRLVIAVAGWLLATRIALVGEHVIEEV
ncbi:hypothetical protein NONO_c75660 [Nocardia nova SH22a]|uniref:Uncharacterized protein n=1 Tax=Nocardia nova SH22a TaxID=1415166 RepID=W5TYI4_9NOCA|nr:hypothetical protein [Nocardia nova]AHH22321.1 hypothetical protein NONO_c75660 [Nocardia nova SH22a]